MWLAGKRFWFLVLVLAFWLCSDKKRWVPCIRSGQAIEHVLLFGRWPAQQEGDEKVQIKWMPDDHCHSLRARDGDNWSNVRSSASPLSKALEDDLMQWAAEDDAALNGVTL